MSESEYSLHPIGVIRSPLRNARRKVKAGQEGLIDELELIVADKT